jgi:hypothetical protein
MHATPDGQVQTPEPQAPVDWVLIDGLQVSTAGHGATLFAHCTNPVLTKPCAFVSSLSTVAYLTSST